MPAAWALEVLDKVPYVTVSMADKEGMPYGLPLSLVRTDEKHDCANDQEAIKVMKGLFPNKKILPIYSKPLIVQGRALHSVTWEYIAKIEI